MLSFSVTAKAIQSVVQTVFLTQTSLTPAQPGKGVTITSYVDCCKAENVYSLSF